ncbi:MAG: gliding motility lipoprotein GldD [Bacteroidales bacterium]|jgi:gliding motility-associated lipoprotein GldD|nr:gliding motility lipoprotein GldD [Bacteroidales bacterium]
MKNYIKIPAFIFGLAFLLTPGCSHPPVPKPHGYFRIDLPEQSYLSLDSTMPYSFEYSDASLIETDLSFEAEPYWINLSYPRLKARIHLSYKEVDNDLYTLLEDNIRLAYKHVVKADAIEEQLYIDEDKNIYALIFEIKGDAASPLQFLATDSLRHFLRGSLYFDARPNRDSLAPVIDYITEDIFHLVETLQWNN